MQKQPKQTYRGYTMLTDIIMTIIFTLIFVALAALIYSHLTIGV